MLNEYGMIAQNEWLKTAQLRDNIFIDTFIIMPDHIHGLLILSHIKTQYDYKSHRNTVEKHCNQGFHKGKVILHRQFGKPIANSLPTIITAYKAAVTRQINRINQNPGRPIWQRNYYEKIVRSDTQLQATRKYILNNPVIGH
jgi:REP element-mobilizing transposase RayT